MAPEGNLTPSQHEILDVVWASGSAGATVAEIWRQISSRRKITRTTVLNQVDRLEKRGWLRRRQRGGTYRYLAAVGRERTAALLAGEFVDDFFGGSASNLVMSLLGSKRLDKDEIEELRKLLSSSSRRKGKEP